MDVQSYVLFSIICPLAYLFLLNLIAKIQRISENPTSLPHLLYILGKTEEVTLGLHPMSRQALLLQRGQNGIFSTKLVEVLTSRKVTASPRLVYWCRSLGAELQKG